MSKYKIWDETTQEEYEVEEYDLYELIADYYEVDPEEVRQDFQDRLEALK